MEKFRFQHAAFFKYFSLSAKYFQLLPISSPAAAAVPRGKLSSGGEKDPGRDSWRESVRHATAAAGPRRGGAQRRRHHRPRQHLRQGLLRHQRRGHGERGVEGAIIVKEELLN